jgi:hypothetical protein
MARSDEYKVEGYGVRSEYDQPYLAGAGFKPEVAFKHAGDPKAQAEYQDEVTESLPGDETFKVVPTHTPINPTHPKTLKDPSIGRDLQPNGEPIHPGPEDLNPSGTEKDQPNGNPTGPVITGPADDK